MSRYQDAVMGLLVVNRDAPSYVNKNPRIVKRFVPTIEMISGILPRSRTHIWTRVNMKIERAKKPKPGYPLRLFQYNIIIRERNSSMRTMQKTTVLKSKKGSVMRNIVSNKTGSHLYSSHLQCKASHV